MKKYNYISSAVLTFFVSTALAQNVGIGTATPAASAKLDITSTNSGLLVPRVALTATNAAGPIAAPATSLLVYNTATSGVAPNNVTPGFYYWSGAAWQRFDTGSNPGPDWKITGNTGTAAASNFIGTTDAIDFVTRTNNAERMRMTSAGNLGIGIGMTAPFNKVDISAAARSGIHGAGIPLYVTGTLGAGSAGAVGVEFRHDNGTQGIGFGFNTIYAAGSNANQDLGMSSKGTGNLNYTTNAAQRMIILGSNGNVGMGLTNPGYGLELNGTFGYGNGTAGTYRSRTETRNDAGQIATQSGFYETSAPVNYPAGATSWWHLIDTRHSNNGNNYAMQIAGSFFDQNFWVRKTNNNAAQAWQQLLTSSNGWMTTGNAGTIAGTNFIGTTDAVDFVTRTNNTEKMRVTSAGNVGIGTNTPGFQLTLGTTGNVFGVENTASFAAKNAGGGYETYFWPRWSDNVMYMNYGANGFNIRNNASATTMFMTNAGLVGIGTAAPGYMLDVQGTIRANDVFGGGGQNIIVGDDSYLSDLDAAHRMGLISTSNANIGELKLGNSGTNPVLSGNPGYLFVDREIRSINNNTVYRRANTPFQFADAFDPSGTQGVHLANNEVEEGGFFANGNYAMIYSPGDNDLVKFVDEDGWDNAGNAYDGTALRARIDGAGQYFQVSDANAKHNIVKMTNTLDKLVLLNGYTYTYNLLPGEIEKNSPKLSGAGVLAQEVEKILPEAVSNQNGNYMVNYSAFVPFFIESIKEQQVLIDQQSKLIQEQQLMLLEMKKEIEKLKTN
ncbi:MAG: tail fiber domain-containing protein [Bacteroidota bacterium]